MRPLGGCCRFTDCTSHDTWAFGQVLSDCLLSPLLPATASQVSAGLPHSGGRPRSGTSLPRSPCPRALLVLPPGGFQQRLWRPCLDIFSVRLASCSGTYRSEGCLRG